jgi:hypothetical protein
MGAPLEARDFADSLRDLIDAGRSFGAHPLWLRIQDGGVDRTGL